MFKLRGFNLLELILAMALSFLLSVTLMSIYASVKRAEQLHQDWLQLIDNGRYAVFVLRRDLKNPNYIFFIAQTSYKNQHNEPLNGLYERDANGDRELVALNINKIEINKNAITMDLSSEDQKIKREWNFNA